MSELSLNYGAEYLDEITQMPRRSQELFFALLNQDVFEEKKQGAEILDTLLNCGDLSYGNCKSPIEQIFNFAYDIVISNEGFPTCELLRLSPQEKICINEHKYIVDFLLDTTKIEHAYFKNHLKIIIECDGHDFHEKTKEQVEKNNVRNLDLQFEGYDILHFSGSQIYRNPIECAINTFHFIKSKVGEFDIDV